MSTRWQPVRGHTVVDNRRATDVNIEATDGHSALQGAHVVRPLTVSEYPPTDTTTTLNTAIYRLYSPPAHLVYTHHPQKPSLLTTHKNLLYSPIQTFFTHHSQSSSSIHICFTPTSLTTVTQDLHRPHSDKSCTQYQIQPLLTTLTHHLQTIHPPNTLIYDSHSTQAHPALTSRSYTSTTYVILMYQH